MDIYGEVIKLAKSVRAQNLFLASKEIASIRLFKNDYDFSRLQEFYLSYLYTFESINRDILIDHISKHVLDDEIFWQSYLLWKQKNKATNKDNKDKKTDKKADKKQVQNKIHLVLGKEIKFPNKEN